jgi:hypothetical protein
MATTDDITMRYNVGLNNVGSYQVSAVPWITGSSVLAADGEHVHHFPRVAKTVTLIANTVGSTSIRLHFNSVNGSTSSGSADVITGRHFVALTAAKDSITLAVKCKEVYISTPSGGSASDYTLIAELTQIPSKRMYPLTGSGLTTSTTP